MPGGNNREDLYSSVPEGCGTGFVEGAGANVCGVAAEVGGGKDGG
jgi:hypothetical protein